MIRRLFLTLLLLLPASLAVAQQKDFFATGGVAIHGYDPVAYFTKGKAVAGVPENSVKWGGAMWYFATDENRVAFEMNPRAYAPQYGGFCAYAMAEGQAAPTVPEAFTITGGKLYLNSSTGVRELWRKDIPGFVARADRAWPQLMDR